MKPKLIIANWKMNLASYKDAKKLAVSIIKSSRNVKNAEVVLCPPFTWLTDLSHEHKEIFWGAQDIFWEECGAHTGEISPIMLKNSGVKYVIIGHSERRALGETDEVVNKKVIAGFKAGLKVILCVGEPKIVRDKGVFEAENFIKAQLISALKGLKTRDLRFKNLVIAYEPIWAISSLSGGKNDTPEDALEMILFIKEFLNSKFNPPVGGQNMRVLYGGSVNAKNAKSFLNQMEIDGVLVGSASLDADEFKKIIRINR